jgi:hypothetical protein
MTVRDSVHDIADVVVIVLGHILAAMLTAAGIWAFEQLFRRYLWPAEDPLLFGHVPLKYLFDAADVSLIGGLIIRGFKQIVSTKSEKGDVR